MKTLHRLVVKKIWTGILMIMRYESIKKEIKMFSRFLIVITMFSILGTYAIADTVSFGEDAYKVVNRIGFERKYDLPQPQTSSGVKPKVIIYCNNEAGQRALYGIKNAGSDNYEFHGNAGLPDPYPKDLKERKSEYARNLFDINTSLTDRVYLDLGINKDKPRIFFFENTKKPITETTTVLLQIKALLPNTADNYTNFKAGKIAITDVEIILKENKPPEWGNDEGVESAELSDQTVYLRQYKELDLPTAKDPDRDPGPSSIGYWLFIDEWGHLNKKNADKKRREKAKRMRLVGNEWGNGDIAPPGMEYSRSFLMIGGRPTERGSWSYIWAASDNWHVIISEPFTITVK